MSRNGQAVSRKPRQRPTRESTRALVLEAAEASFVKHGFHGAKIEEIAERAGFTKGAVYSSFANKDEMFLELLAERVERRSAVVAQAVADIASGPAQARALGEALDGLMDSEAEWTPLLLEFWLHALREPALRLRLGVLRQRLRQSIAAAFKTDMPISSEAAATVVFALSNGLSLERLTDPDAVPPSLLPVILERLLSNRPAKGGA
jgi:AcrR family transcriptional regulator